MRFGKYCVCLVLYMMILHSSLVAFGSREQTGSRVKKDLPAEVTVSTITGTASVLRIRGKVVISGNEPHLSYFFVDHSSREQFSIAPLSSARMMGEYQGYLLQCEAAVSREEDAVTGRRVLTPLSWKIIQ